MSSLAQLTVHVSQFPENVRRDLLESFRTRQINHKFHYDSVKQTHRWLALHRAYSPFRNDPQAAAIYNRGFEVAAAGLKTGPVHVIGLGCGGGEKDAKLLRLLHNFGNEVFYTPSDSSAAMVLVARQTALEVLEEARCFPLVWDLATAGNLHAVLEEFPVGSAVRLVTFFGMLPNFEPQIILPQLADLIRPGEYLLLSANLAPGPDYAGGVQRILPLYDNALTREWLITFLLDAGVDRDDGEIRFAVENDAANVGLKRITAHFEFKRACEIEVETEKFRFQPGNSIRLFFSYRHNSALVYSLLGACKLKVLDEWITDSGEEGVFLVTR